MDHTAPSQRAIPIGSRRRRPWRSALIGLSALLLLGSAAWAGPPPPDDESSPFAVPEPDANAVTAKLLCESDGVVPGRPLLLGVHLHMKPGWHTYWKNGGDAGLPTEIEWKLPEGFEAGEIQWPTPHRYVEAGELVTYGYADDVLLLVPLSAPEDLQPGQTVRIGAEVSWLMCKELCIPGDAKLELELPVLASSSPSSQADFFAQSRSQLPRDPETVEGLELDAYLSLNAVPPGQSAHAAFVLRAPSGAFDGEATWFPEADAKLWPGAVEWREEEGVRTLILPFEVDPSAEPGEALVLAGVIQFAGSEMPAIAVELPIPVAAADQELALLHEEVFGTDTTDAATAPHGGSIWRYLLLALVGGVILNIMPCVLPVLSLKVMGFVTHADRDHATVVRLSLVFMLGVLASFLTLALVVIALQQAGELLGWGFQFQNPVFVVVMIAVVFGFGLSLFGLYEIIPPVGGFGGGEKGIYAEQFFNGVLATILATPCSAPFLGTALGFAFTQPAAVILAIFLTIGIGLALPYVLLSLNPGWLRFVPKPGPWMERFKQFMGFLLMATAVWLLWVLGQQLGGDGVIHALWFLLVLGLVLWIHGAFLSFTSSTARRITVWVLTLILLVAGWAYFLGDTLSAEGLAAARENGPTIAHGGGIDWIEFSPERLEAEVNGGKTVFVDFTAAWCLTCKANEKAVIGTDEVRAKLDELGVVSMVGDWTQRDPVISQVLRKYGRSGVPFYAVFPAGALDDPIILPEVIHKGMVIEALEKAGASRS